ncbi:MAG: hypothetical protein ACREBK_00475, partial [Sphingomicrobium sp.]
QEHADGDQDREERAKAHGRHMPPEVRMGNFAPTNGQVDKTNACPDARAMNGRTHLPNFAQTLGWWRAHSLAAARWRGW